jgi:hypothetical protein
VSGWGKGTCWVFYYGRLGGGYLFRTVLAQLLFVLSWWQERTKEATNGG